MALAFAIYYLISNLIINKERMTLLLSALKDSGKTVLDAAIELGDQEITNYLILLENRKAVRQEGCSP